MSGFGAYEIASLIHDSWTENGSIYAVNYEDISPYVGGGSTDGQFNVTVNGRRFSVHVFEYEDEQSE